MGENAFATMVSRNRFGSGVRRLGGWKVVERGVETYGSIV